MRWNKTEVTGWGRALRGEVEVARPERARALAELVTASPAPALGQRRSYGDVALNDGGRAVDMTRLDRIIAFDATTGLLEVEAGAPIGVLGQVLTAQGWIPPVMPGTGFATVGGCIANDVHGKNHHEVGSFGQHITEINLLTPQGPKQASPTENAELFAATMGGLGQTGIVQSAKIQLLPCKGDMMVLTERRLEDWDAHLAALDEAKAPYCVGWIDATAQGAKLGRGILEEGEITSGISPDAKRAREVPINAPGWALSGPIVRAFNELYFRRVPPTGRTTVKPISAPFFPLDKIHNWNRLYGKRGFHQFQCVVPLSEAETLRQMLDHIAQSRLASPLAVLKRMGPGRAGPLSFPMEGYTLAVDFPNRAGLTTLYAHLQRMTQEAGGRIYFAKDALAGPGGIDVMYPDLDKWRSTVNSVDPDGLLVTDLVRRLKLRGEA